MPVEIRDGHADAFCVPGNSVVDADFFWRPKWNFEGCKNNLKDNNEAILWRYSKIASGI